MVTKSLEASTTRWNLLEHPFYQAWNAGTLPQDDLKTYAQEYGVFIKAISEGWRTLGDEEHADEELEHAELWRKFARTLDTDVTGENEVPSMAHLVSRSQALFGEKSTAIGALFAFEAQQPRTSATKLVGLRQHFDLGPDAEEYFTTHADDYHEAEDLQEAWAALDENGKARASAACEEMCRCLWDALSGVYSGDPC